MAEQRRKRLERLLEKIRLEQTTSIDQLADAFGVSTATIRRDIKDLEKTEAVVQTIGGGVRYQTAGSTSNGENLPDAAIAEKIRIAEYCIGLIEARDDILVGPGTTTFLVARILSGITDREFRLITPSLELAHETSAAPNIRTVMLGGEVQGTYVSGFGAGHEYFRTCHRDHTLVMSVDGVHAASGLTVYDPQVVPMLRAMMAVSRRTIVVADSSKIGSVFFASVSELSDASILITDAAAPRAVVQDIQSTGIEVVLV